MQAATSASRGWDQWRGLAVQFEAERGVIAGIVSRAHQTSTRARAARATPNLALLQSNAAEIGVATAGRSL